MRILALIALAFATAGLAGCLEDSPPDPAAIAAPPSYGQASGASLGPGAVISGTSSSAAADCSGQGATVDVSAAGRGRLVARAFDGDGEQVMLKVYRGNGWAVELIRDVFGEPGEWTVVIEAYLFKRGDDGYERRVQFNGQAQASISCL